MPAQGRPRLRPEDLEVRIADYCRRYKAARSATGLPVFPTGKRETRQHREWIALYKLHNRLGRRSRGQCERCPEPAVAGSVFCETHRAQNSGTTVSMAPGERRSLLAQQNGCCPVCGLTLATSDSVEFDRQGSNSGPRALLHGSCARLATSALTLGPEGLARLQEFLWPSQRARTKPRKS